MQTQLNKVIQLLQNKSRAKSPIIANDGLSTSEDNIIGNLKFSIETKEQLDALEYKLLEKDVMTFLVSYCISYCFETFSHTTHSIKKFSASCGSSGLAKISKVGLSLMKLLINDELLTQFT